MLQVHADHQRMMAHRKHRNRRRRKAARKHRQRPQYSSGGKHGRGNGPNHMSGRSW